MNNDTLILWAVWACRASVILPFALVAYIAWLRYLDHARIGIRLIACFLIAALINIPFQWLWWPPELHNLITAAWSVSIIATLFVGFQEVEDAALQIALLSFAKQREAEKPPIAVPGETEVQLAAKVDDLIERLRCAPSTDALSNDTVPIEVAEEEVNDEQ